MIGLMARSCSPQRDGDEGNVDGHNDYSFNFTRRQLLLYNKNSFAQEVKESLAFQGVRVGAGDHIMFNTLVQEIA